MIYQILKNHGFKIIDIKTGLFKDTSRWSRKYICECEGNKIYAVIANTSTQKFYLKRSVEWVIRASELYSDCFSVTIPFAYGEYMDSYYALYVYRDYNLNHKSIIPPEKLDALYKTQAQTVIVTEEVVKKIKEKFLKSFPENYKERICSLSNFNKYFNEIKKLHTVKVWYEHGDFTCNNLSLESDGRFELIDYEFFREYQPCGFDIYDYNSSIGKTDKSDSLNALKQLLINEINDIIDGAELPEICIQKEAIDYNSAVFPNFIHNRLDMKYGADNIINFGVVEDNNRALTIQGHIDGDIMELAVWLTPIQQRTFNHLIDFIFKSYPKISSINLMYSKNDYKGLTADNHWMNILPDNENDYFNSLGKNTRHNQRRYSKRLNDDFDVEMIHFKDDFDRSIVEKYFEFKMNTHGTNYHLTTEEYLKKYCITDADVLYLDGEIVGVNFLNVMGENAYFENVSYDIQYGGRYIGIVLYYFSICNLIKTKVKRLFLANGEYQYKANYGAIEEIAFNGSIQRAGFSLRTLTGTIKRNFKRAIKKFVRPISEVAIIKRIIAKAFGGGYRFIEVKKIKPTARCPVSIIVEDSNGAKYLLVIALSDIQRFYLRRSISIQKVFSSMIGKEFQINFPINVKYDSNFDYVMYKYFDDYIFCDNMIPVEILTRYYNEAALEVNVNEDSIDEICENLLLTWPIKYRKQIRTLQSFKSWVAKINSMDRVSLFLEHGDFNNENVLINKEIMLIDFEFGAFCQPVGFDKFSFIKSLEINQYDKLAEIKSGLMDDANDVLDKEHHYRISNTLLYYITLVLVRFNSLRKRIRK